MQRGAINNALQGFLGTYTSRYTRWHGYWLFGFIVADLDEDVCFDLLTGRGDLMSPQMSMVAARLASLKFREQLGKTGVPPERLCAAQLQMSRLPGAHRRVIAPCIVRDCREVVFTASATRDDGKFYERATSVLVAPHDPALERSSWSGASD